MVNHIIDDSIAYRNAISGGSRGGGGIRGKCPSRRNLGRAFNVSMPPPRKFFTDAPKSTYKLKTKHKNEILFLFMVINLQDVSMISFLVAITHESVVL